MPTSITFDEYRDAQATGFASPGDLLFEGEAAVCVEGVWGVRKAGHFAPGVRSWVRGIEALAAFIAASSGPERPVEGGRLLFFPGPCRPA